MPNRNHRVQKSELVDAEDTRPLVVTPLTNLDDRINNPKDIEPDEAAMAQGVEHSNNLETHAETRNERGGGGRKARGDVSRTPRSRHV